MTVRYWINDGGWKEVFSSDEYYGFDEFIWFENPIVHIEEVIA